MYVFYRDCLLFYNLISLVSNTEMRLKIRPIINRPSFLSIASAVGSP
jgi:hypothetical protein